MIQVKEFINYNENEQLVNDWLKENDVDIIDIKYSVSTFQDSEMIGCEATEYSGILIVYNTK